MRSGVGVASRPMAYDRGPTTKSFNYLSSGVAPHGQTVRFTYTVPAGRKATVYVLDCETNREQVAAPAGNPRGTFYLTPSGGSGVPILVCWLKTNVAGDKQHVTAAMNATLVVGDAIDFRTTDDSTGGSFGYNASLALTEFDA